MFQLVRKHLTYANVAATLAVVLAITGSAVAATGGIGHDEEDPGGKHNGSGGKGGGKGNADGVAYVVSAHAAKSKGGKGKGSRGPRGPRGLTGPAGKEGKQGPAGPGGAQGPAGAAGAKGETGPAGAGGSGPAGEGVTVAKLNPGEEGCFEGGAKFSNATGTATACNGEAAAGGGFPETLPAGATETGVWSINTGAGFEYAEGEVAPSSTISFPIMLEEGLTLEQTHYINSSGEELKATGGPVKEPPDCKGNAEAPTAAPGNLCIYEVRLSEPPGNGGQARNPAAPFGTNVKGTATTGTVLIFRADEVATLKGYGTWAVTAK